jgi:hypothetical protein
MDFSIYPNKKKDIKIISTNGNLVSGSISR